MTITPTLPAPLGRLSNFVAAKFGLSYPPERWRDLERALKPAVEAERFGTLDHFAEWLLSDAPTASELEAVAARLTIGETYFFRETQAFAVLREHLIPEFLQAQRSAASQFRVWSAGCCTGEEPYSLAIFLHRHCPELRARGISILATDLNPHFLRKAREGIYRSWSFRGAPEWLQRDYFHSLDGDRFELRPEIRRMVEFEPLNLADDCFPSLHNRTDGLDLIFCRNVLMYFSAPQAQRVMAGFHRSLVAGGHVVVGVCEVSAQLGTHFRSRPFCGVTLYQKPVPAVATALRASSADAGPLSWIDRPGPVRPLSRPPAPAESESLARAAELFRAGDYAAAAQQVAPVLVRGPLNLQAATLLARALANLGRLAEARQWLERALVIHKLHAPLHYLQATILQEQGEPHRAAVALENALYLEPEYVLAHVALADLAGRAGRAKKARRHLAEALRVLRSLAPDEVLPETDGLTVRRMIAIIDAMQEAAKTS